MSESNFRPQILLKAPSVKVHRDKMKTVGVLVLASIFVGGGFALVLNDETLPQAKAYLLLTLLSIFTLMMLVAVAQLFDRRPAMEFLDDGLLVPEMSDRLITWSAIRSVSLRKVKAGGYLIVEFDPAAERQMRFKLLHRILRVTNKMLGYRHHVINASMFDSDPDYLVQIINFHIAKERGAK